MGKSPDLNSVDSRMARWLFIAVRLSSTLTGVMKMAEIPTERKVPTNRASLRVAYVAPTPTLCVCVCVCVCVCWFYVTHSPFSRS